MEKMNYKMASRATILLGRESVSRVDGAMIELIKNTYDADASLCYICFDAQNDVIYIIDNGTGMTKGIIENHWMMIGTDNKRLEYRSSKKRIKSGEKGIGRFALDRLGSKCTMYTKSESEKLIRWYTDWSSFEVPGKTLEQVEAEFEYLDGSIMDFFPPTILHCIETANSKNAKEFSISTGTILKISGLRDNWSNSQIEKTIKSIGFIIPPGEQTSFSIFVQNDLKSSGYELNNDVTDDFDYRIEATFDGNMFRVTVERRELDFSILPMSVLAHPRFKDFPYRPEDLREGIYTKELTIPELLRNTNTEYIKTVSELGNFSFVYMFMKASVREDGRGVNYYRSIGRNRKKWLDEYAGIKIYRDNFVVRPYGDKTSNSFDWLGLDARKGINPVAASDKSEQWHVNNSQGQGTVSISRINNSAILDKSSREGIIENEHFFALCDALRSMIGIIEKDRSYIARTIRLYTEEQEEREKAKQEAKDIARSMLEDEKKQKKQSDETGSTPPSDDTYKLAKAVKFFEEEVEELISEIRLLRALATNGLITTSMVHDLKGLNAMLVSRVETLKTAIKMSNTSLVERHLHDMSINDEFLRSWINVITAQSNRDKRRRLKKDLSFVINNCISMLSPILVRKKVEVDLSIDINKFERRIFEADFDSIIYNLIINSVESFEHSRCADRKIAISTEAYEDEYKIHYSDNGAGLSEAFSAEPYKIFDYGTTSKYDNEGNQLGTGLGMYIFASSVSEYKGTYLLTKIKDGFGITITIPKGGSL